MRRVRTACLRAVAVIRRRTVAVLHSAVSGSAASISKISAAGRKARGQITAAQLKISYFVLRMMEGRDTQSRALTTAGHRQSLRWGVRPAGDTVRIPQNRSSSQRINSARPEGDRQDLQGRAGLLRAPIRASAEADG